jgi:hypothetical protein
LGGIGEDNEGGMGELTRSEAKKGGDIVGVRPNGGADGAIGGLEETVAANGLTTSETEARATAAVLIPDSPGPCEEGSGD